MTAEEIEAIVGGYHGDAFRVLGPHSVRKRGGQPRWEVRAFLPQAERADVVLAGGQLCPMVKQHPQGFFCASLSGEPAPYRLRLRLWDESEIELDDPYRFGPQISDADLYLHTEGTLHEAYKSFGAHTLVVDGSPGVRFAVWAPNAEDVTVAGEFNDWDIRRHPMRRRNGGVWELFIPGLGQGAVYKYNVRSRFAGYQQLKADPYAFYCEAPPKSASVVWDIERYRWGDAEWMDRRGRTDWLKSPISIYEVHLESWLRGPMGQALTYRELAVKLVEYVKRMGYTHIELLPIMEHPFSGSWGYQVTGYFAPTSRFGTPDDFRFFVDHFHQAGIGVIVDWVPGHFPKDAHGLVFFDGTALYEHADPRKGEHREWGTLVFNYGRNEVRAFLISNALFWLKEYHIDGLRVDAVASMLYLDYSRKAGEWIPNQYGGNENLEAIDFLRRFNELAHQVPGAFTVAEESTAFPGVSKPVYLNGLGFTMKWNMGWMHDMLGYFSQDPIYRKYHHNAITFSLLYAFHENFVLPISHDEVVHGKGSLLGKMPGDEWRSSPTRAPFWPICGPIPARSCCSWDRISGSVKSGIRTPRVRWELLEFDFHRKLQDLVRELNRLYARQPGALPGGFPLLRLRMGGFPRLGEFHHLFRAPRRRTPRDRPVLLQLHARAALRLRVRRPRRGLLRGDSEHRFGDLRRIEPGQRRAGLLAPLTAPQPCASISVTLPPLAVVAFRKR